MPNVINTSTTPLPLGRAVRLFFSYTQEDSALRDELDKHLAVLRRRGVVECWHDRKISAGEDWRGAIDNQLNRADIILLLVSADFLASDYCWDVELRRAMERHRAREARVIPVILRPCHWQDAPFSELELLPSGGRAVTGSAWRSHDEAFEEVARVIAGIAQPAAPVPNESQRAVLRPYLDQLMRDNEALVPYFQQAEVVLLDQVFVPIDVVPQGNLTRPVTPGTHYQGKGVRLRTALGLDNEYPTRQENRWILRGDPGAGKTTLLRHLARTLANERKLRWIPVLVSLPRLIRESIWLLDAIRRRLERSGHHSADIEAALETAAAEGQLLLLLDGLDEVPRDRKADADEFIRDVAGRWPKSTVVVATRPIGYRRPAPHFRELDLLPINRDRRREFLARWFRAEPEGELAWTAADSALHFLESDRNLWELCGNPLYLTLLALLLRGGHSPQKNRTKLYDQVFDLLFEGRHRLAAQPIDAKDAVHNALRYIAQTMTHDNSDSEAVATLESRLLAPDADGIRQSLERLDRWRSHLRLFLEDVANQTGILGPHDGPDDDWRFWHRTFREALAAEWLEQRYVRGGEQALLAHAASIAGDEGSWAEPYALLVGRTDAPDELVTVLADANPMLSLRALATAQNLEAETVDMLLGLTDNAEQRVGVFLRIPDLLKDGERALILLERARRTTRNGLDLYFIGEALNDLAIKWPSLEKPIRDAQRQLFDHIPHPRSEEMARFQTCSMEPSASIDLWRYVPAGRFVMGVSQSYGNYSSFDEEPAHVVHISRPFKIAAIPITNAQYAMFDPGKPLPSSVLAEEQVGQRARTHVSWYEAVSFCRWLGGAAEFAGAKLPTEAEWEFACMGSCAPMRTTCSTSDDEIELSPMVALNSPNHFGVYDMLGFVWQWTSDWYGRYNNHETDEVDPTGPSVGARRVVRGGSYRSPRGSNRRTARAARIPSDAQNNLGFRVALPVVNAI